MLFVFWNRENRISKKLKNDEVKENTHADEDILNRRRLRQEVVDGPVEGEKNNQ